MGFKKYFELISHLLVVKQHNNFLMKNHESRPPGTALFPEVNAAYFHQTRHERSPGPIRDRDRGRARYFNHGDLHALNNDPQHQQFKKKGEAPEAASRTNTKNKCCRCGGNGHWSRICRTSKHLVKLYQVSFKKSDNDVEANHISEDNTEPMNLDASDFFIISKGYDEC
ncbi:uncharacterized protein LOC107865755 [Capsicum annuum]|uniref:uncharacterized protein LOC107865755 n=1 Tax=Capsicum annuum TaxID=4072 RepID=UPI001FB0C9D1|nr:uncharacterized protein LOC107865755 [Capsicum annuum]